VKKDVKSKVAKKWLDGRLMANNENSGEFDAKSWRRQPELSLLNFFSIGQPSSHFLAGTLDFTSFFTMAFLGATHIFLQLGCFGLDIIIVVTHHACNETNK